MPFKPIAYLAKHMYRNTRIVKLCDQKQIHILGRKDIKLRLILSKTGRIKILMTLYMTNNNIPWPFRMENAVAFFLDAFFSTVPTLNGDLI